MFVDAAALFDSTIHRAVSSTAPAPQTLSKETLMKDVPQSSSEESLCSLRFASHVNTVELGARGGGAKRNIVQLDDNGQPLNKQPARRATMSRRATMVAGPATRRSSMIPSAPAATNGGSTSPAKRTRASTAAARSKAVDFKARRV